MHRCGETDYLHISAHPFRHRNIAIDSLTMISSPSDGSICSPEMLARTSSARIRTFTEPPVKTTGNWITRTTYINAKAEKPHQSFVFLKGMTFPLVILGIMAILTATATGLSESAGKIQLALGLFFLLPPILDYLFYRFKSDNLGLWDTLFGGVWLVKTAKTAESKGWLKRLEQLGDYTEAQGWLSDGDSKDSSD